MSSPDRTTECPRSTTSCITSLTRSSNMHVFVTGGTGHSGPYIICDLIAAGHEVTALARSDKSAEALSALGAKVRRGDLDDLDGLKAAAADSDGVIHVAHRQDLLPTGGLDAVAAAEQAIMLAYGEALKGTGKPLVTSGASARRVGNIWAVQPPRRTPPSLAARSSRAPCEFVTSSKRPYSASPSKACGSARRWRSSPTCTASA